MIKGRGYVTSELTPPSPNFHTTSNKTSARQHLSDYDRGLAAGRLEEVQCHYGSCCNGCIEECISRLKKAAESRKALQKHSGCRGRNTTPLEDHYTALVTKRNRNVTPG
ncbi:hypothetical protein TNCV_1552781 [Trichonephila clavipes]|nr:hypothetical protein TNCV_1552781 [Trichonephila clavipes]